MIGIDTAIKSRWSATGMAALVPHGPYLSRLPEEFVTFFPYCIYTNVSDVIVARTPETIYHDAQVQFQVYGLTDIEVGDACEAIGQNFLSSDRARTSPLYNSVFGIVDVRIVSDYTITQESDQVYVGTMVLGIQYGKESGLTPR